MVAADPRHSPPLTRRAVPDPALTAATRATFAAFVGCGFAFASWASRIPQVRDRLGLSASELGFVLLAIAAGSVVALPLAGRVVTAVGSRRTVAYSAVVLSVGLIIAALGSGVGIFPVIAGLFLLGLANGAWDVAMNVQGASVERKLGRSIMSRFHAGFSVGTVAGAAVGAVMIAAHVAVPVHLVAVAVLVAIVVPYGVREFLGDGPDSDGPDTEVPDTEVPDTEVPDTEVPDTDAVGPPEAAETDGAPAAARTPGRSAWRERRTLLVGVFVLAFAFGEGAGNDWIAIAMLDGYHVPAAVGTLVFAAFLSAMTAGRWVGPTLLDRYGRARVVRLLTLIAVVGLGLFVARLTAPLALVGAVLWGAGISLGFPVGMSAAADEPDRAAARVSVVASIGYCAFLGGPPLVGFLGQHVSVVRALSAVAVLLAVAAVLAGQLKPVPASRRQVH